MSSDMALNRLEKPQSLDEQAYEQIKEAIINCVFNPGDFLAEVRLAEELGISKTPIRKAMARLHQEGFLDNVPYRGYFVADISIEDITEIYTLREILECHLVCETTGYFSQVELNEMAALVVDAEAALNHGDNAAFVRYNREFHHCFSRKCGSQRIEDVLKNLEEHVRRIIMYVLREGHTDLLDFQRDDHGLILQAVSAKDTERAQMLMRSHLRTFSKALIDRKSLSLTETTNN